MVGWRRLDSRCLVLVSRRRLAGWAAAEICSKDSVGTLRRRCCVALDRSAQDPSAVDVHSDGSGEFNERGSDAAVLAGFDAEFVVASPQALHERMTSHDHAGAVVAFESTHWAEPGLEPGVVGFDPVVRVLRGVVERGRQQLLHDREERPSPVGHYLNRLPMAPKARRRRTAARPWCPIGLRLDVDDLPVLVDRPVDVTSMASDLHVGLIDEPAIADRVAAGRAAPASSGV